MTVGLETYTDAGKLQFAAIARQDIYVCTEKGSGTSVSGIASDGSGAGLLVNFTTAPTVIAARATGTPVHGGNLGQDAFSSPDFPYPIITGAAGHNVQWWGFKRLRDISVPSSAVGLQVFNADGSTAYHSNYWPFAVAAKIPITTMSLGMSQFTALPAGRTHAAVLYGTSILRRGLPHPNDILVAFPGARFSTSPQGVYIEAIQNWNDAFAAANEYGTGGMLIVDVTGIP